MPRNVLALAIVFVVTAAVYAGVSGAYFTGYDDFLETHRAAFEDTQAPARMFTTSHFDSPKYRPLGRALDYLTYHLGGGSPVAFRVRNLIGHLWCAAMLYGIVLLLFRSWAIAFPSALLFALHPLTNQSVVLTTSTDTMADALTLTSLLLFMHAAETKKRPIPWLALSCLTAFVELFIYESGVVVFGLMFVYLALLWLRKPKRTFPGRNFVLALTLFVTLIGVSFLAIRARILNRSPQRSAVTAVAKNLILYSGAVLASPLDSILAHDLFGAPLPSEMHLDSSAALPMAAGLVSLLIAGALLWRKKQPLPWLEMLFLAGAAVAFLLPFLLFNEHASETYMYFPAAMYCVLVCVLLYHTIRQPQIYIAAISILAILFAIATYNRNGHVESGAVIASRIASSLPVDHWKQGAWEIRLAEADPPLPRYGIYQYQGLATIDVGDPSMPAATCLLQLLTRNPELTARVVRPAEMRAAPCPRPGTCFWVGADGSISPVP
jgi:hypothetical protein